MIPTSGYHLKQQYQVLWWHQKLICELLIRNPVVCKLTEKTISAVKCGGDSILRSGLLCRSDQIKPNRQKEMRQNRNPPATKKVHGFYRHSDLNLEAFTVQSSEECYSWGIRKLLLDRTGTDCADSGSRQNSLCIIDKQL